MKLMLTNKTYDVLKWVCLIVFPALEALLTIVGNIWAIEAMPKIVMTLNAVAAFLGALIGVSTANYNKQLVHYV